MSRSVLSGVGDDVDSGIYGCRLWQGVGIRIQEGGGPLNSRLYSGSPRKTDEQFISQLYLQIYGLQMQAGQPEFDSLILAVAGNDPNDPVW